MVWFGPARVTIVDKSELSSQHQNILRPINIDVHKHNQPKHYICAKIQLFTLINRLIGKAGH